MKKKSCFAIESNFSELNLPINFNLMDLYDLGSLLDEQSFLISGRASQILNWDKTHRFCGKCGSKNRK
ncbi:NUDIX-like domain-containing protein [Clostridium ljungdahlii]|uniref:NUDIX-like domain-containing protein n=1 Tax=Clostridium ljungdahlii TaxID=1538 RepID=UPI003869E350